MEGTEEKTDGNEEMTVETQTSIHRRKISKRGYVFNNMSLNGDKSTDYLIAYRVIETKGCALPSFVRRLFTLDRES